ncbi:ExbD/TolR family protein [Saccharophagus degradans]|uniref:Biopolymer transport protein ExbD/TolR n=2 Tax=Saccharophagus degradans TaxID=86304 RepID=Q21NW0_SACD2|nr:biopolymer transporter ExbD [Saccharophagus degradans]ABD79619.1 Biopolymer transport protein ExbD/TolR [Saccharophagus degradans 2-40]MBU2986358.1 biopolymer transporter ExbD [Saccharophagus degradans]MDO6423429.1 biopolymer transporter ExbD [Saccharophagus degradans]MDO6606834.1 biopolymer transporter ExbD [Saccharophagus degradans]WGO98234.1 biopolymer transporter ExbD [Saccharophagus degradans]
MSSRNTKSEEEVGAIDLTPMLDVVFIMLIFFIVTASFIKEPGIEVNRPDATTVEPKANANILVAISSDNEIWINKSVVDPRQVETQLQVLLSENPKSALVIQADNEANVKTMAEVTEAARKVGIADVSVSAEKK